MFGGDVKKTALKGRVEKQALGGRSKNAHQGFVLRTPKGLIKLRREGGNPFYDAFFEKYESLDVTVKGYNMQNYFLVTDLTAE